MHTGYTRISQQQDRQTIQRYTLTHTANIQTHIIDTYRAHHYTQQVDTPKLTSNNRSKLSGDG